MTTAPESYLELTRLLLTELRTQALSDSAPARTSANPTNGELGTILEVARSITDAAGLTIACTPRGDGATVRLSGRVAPGVHSWRRALLATGTARAAAEACATRLGWTVHIGSSMNTDLPDEGEFFVQAWEVGRLT